MSLFFYDVCLSSKLKLVFHDGIRGGERIADFVRVKIFSSSLLHAAFSLHFLSALRSTIAVVDEKRRERKTIVS